MKKSPKLSRRQFLELSAMLGTGTAASIFARPFLAFAQDATATPGTLPPPPEPGPIDLEAAGGMDALIEAARAEGELSTIALPDDWANYGQMKKDFFAKYDFLKYNDLAPDGSSAEEIEAIKANAGNSGPQNPDTIDVGFIWGKTAKAEGLLQPYKVATWDSIPDDLKDPDGYWIGNYFGTMAFEVNTDVISNPPLDWADLLKPEYQGLIALAGDPTAGSQNTHAVWAAAYAMDPKTALDSASAGLEFFKQLADSGNLISTVASPATLAKGETPITFRWDYNALANRDANVDIAKIEVIYPKSGTLAGVYLHGINAYSPRPNAARLWAEYLYSDEGQLTWLSGYAKPARYADLLERGVIPEELAAKLPVVDVEIGFPTFDQLEKQLTTVREDWPNIVGLTFAS